MTDLYFWGLLASLVGGIIIGRIAYKDKVKNTSYKCPWCSKWHYVEPVRRDPESDFINTQLDKSDHKEPS